MTIFYGIPGRKCFQFLGIPPKGELQCFPAYRRRPCLIRFPISRDPPEGGTVPINAEKVRELLTFPISRDPPEGGTITIMSAQFKKMWFPISRDPPEGGTT